MRVKVLLFAAAREAVGRDAVELESAGTVSIGGVREELKQRFPKLGPMSAHLLWAVNNKFVDEESLVSDGDTVACFPPVSGG